MDRRGSARRTMLLVLALCIIPLLACDLSAITGSNAAITNAVMAKEVTADNFDPVGITDVYSFDQPKFHAVISLSDAPANTLVKAVWIAVDVGNIVAPNTQIDQTEIQAQGTRNLDFSLTPNGAGWPSGAYQVEIYLDGKLDRTLKFTVAPAPAPTAVPPTAPPPTLAPPTPTPVVGEPCPAVPPTSTKFSGLISNVVMATDVEGPSKEPVNPTSIFAPSAVFHAVVTVQNAPADTKFTAIWYATDLGSPNCNIRIDAADLTTDGSRNIDFTLSPKTVWPDGEYRVEVSVNDVVDRVIPFVVRAGGAPPASLSPTATPKPTVSPRPAASPTSSRPPIPSGQGGLMVISHYGKEINFTINNKLYKVPPNGTLSIFLPPGKYPYSANIPGVGSANDIIEIQLGTWFTQTFSD